jgi:HEPN domain-containing protein
MDAKLHLVKTWLIKAERDLASARPLASGPDPFYDTAIYHCQQAAEKALKGWLTFHDQPFEKTHDLRLLIESAARIDIGFTNHFTLAENLTPYATAYRYPGDLSTRNQVNFKRRWSRLKNFSNIPVSISQ